VVRRERTGDVLRHGRYRIGLDDDHDDMAPAHQRAVVGEDVVADDGNQGLAAIGGGVGGV